MKQFALASSAAQPYINGETGPGDLAELVAARRDQRADPWWRRVLRWLRGRNQGAAPGLARPRRNQLRRGLHCC